MVPQPPPPPPIVYGNANYAPVGKEPPRLFKICMNAFNTVTQLLLGAIVCVAFIFTNQYSPSSSFKQHVYLCVTGYVILMSQAILSISPFSWASSLRYEEKKIVHWAMQVLGSVLAITGSIIRITNIDEHLQTPHGIFGILAFIFTCLSLIGGVVNLFSMKLKINPSLVKIAHSCIGSLTLILAFLALVFGFDKTEYRLEHSNTNGNMMIAFTVIALIGTLMPACVNNVKRLSK